MVSAKVDVHQRRYKQLTKCDSRDTKNQTLDQHSVICKELIFIIEDIVIGIVICRLCAFRFRFRLFIKMPQTLNFFSLMLKEAVLHSSYVLHPTHLLVS